MTRLQQNNRGVRASISSRCRHFVGGSRRRQGGRCSATAAPGQSRCYAPREAPSPPLSPATCAADRRGDLSDSQGSSGIRPVRSRHARTDARWLSRPADVRAGPRQVLSTNCEHCSRSCGGGSFREPSCCPTARHSSAAVRAGSRLSHVMTARC